MTTLGHVLALKSLSELPNIIKGSILSDMEDRKTITMPYSEYLKLKSDAARYKETKDEVKRELIKEYNIYIEKYFEKSRECSELNAKLSSINVEIMQLRNELYMLKRSKWWNKFKF